MFSISMSILSTVLRQGKGCNFLITVTSGCNGDPIGFLCDKRQMNVALSRAKEARFVVGHQSMPHKESYADTSNNMVL